MRRLVPPVSPANIAAGAPAIGPDHDGVIGDDELTALALAADPREDLSEGAVPISFVLGEATGTLSSWYMPTVAATRVAGWKRPLVVAIVVTLVTLEALGLCSVFGQVVIG